MKNKLLSITLLLFLGILFTVHGAGFGIFRTNFAKSDLSDYQRGGRLQPVRDEDGNLVYLQNDSLDQSGDSSLQKSFEPIDGKCYEINLETTISPKLPNGKNQGSGGWAIQLKDSKSNQVVSLMLQCTRYYNGRKAVLSLGKKRIEFPYNFPLESKLKLTLLFNPEGSMAAFITEEGKIAFHTGNFICRGFTPDTAVVYTRTFSSNDGMNTTMHSVELISIEKDDYEALAEKPYNGPKDSTPYCATEPRHYKFVNTNVYNAAIATLVGDNLIDRIALATPETAKKRAEELADLGFNIVLYNGRHFRSNFVEEYTSISNSAKNLANALKEQNIGLIEHHDPTIMSYRGYPMMLHTLDWLQRDIRTGETSYWYCPQNQNFVKYMMDYLLRYQQEVHAAGFMIDELTYGSGNMCACDYCRESYREATGKEVPTWSNPAGMDADQKEYRRFALSKVLQLESDMLNSLQQIEPNTTLMTYCSDYGDAISLNEDLTRTAAYSCPFVGWENMICFPMTSWVSHLRNLKMRNGYGDFYNIPTWSLNRESCSKEAHFSSWMMCQAARHGIWYGGQGLLSTPENIEFFKKYNKWPAVMKHQFARTLTHVAVLNSTQTQKASQDRNFAWYDYIGTVDTFLRNNLQYATLLDGDLFYPDRLDNWNVIIMPSQAALSQTQCDNLAKWVENGGTAVVIGNTSRFDEYGNMLQDYRLARTMKITWDGSLSGNFSITAPDSDISYSLNSIEALDILDDNAVKVLVNATDNNGEKYPFATETQYGKGRFIAVAGQTGNLLYEMELRNGRSYNYQDVPGASAFLCWLYRYANNRVVQPVVFENFPKDVPAVANQLLDGPDADTIYVQIMNFTGKNAEYGRKYSYGVPENYTFPALNDTMLVHIAVPCNSQAVIEAPFYDDIQIEGTVNDAGITTFEIPGSAIKDFAQLHITGATAQLALLEPPIKENTDSKIYTMQDKPFSIEKFYKNSKINGEIIDAPASITLGDFSIAKDGTVSCKENVILKPEIWHSANQVALPTVKANVNEGNIVAWMDNEGTTRGYLYSASLMDGNVAAVQEIAAVSPSSMEITVGGTLMPKDHVLASIGPALRISKSLLKGVNAKFHYGMHRSNFPEKQYTFTGEEPDGQIKAVSQVRDIQFLGDNPFSIDFCCMGPWGLYSEDLNSETAAFFMVDGDDYVVFMSSGRQRYGTKFVRKVVVRSGITDFDVLHPTRFAHYQYNRGTSYRLQFTDGPTVNGMTVAANNPFYNVEFSNGSLDMWEKAAVINHAPNAGPLFSAGAFFEDGNSITVEHQNSFVLVNIALAACEKTSKGEAIVNGRKEAFDIPVGSKKTIVIPAQITDGRLKIDFNGQATVSGIMLQPIMFPAEDFMFTRTFWNIGTVPYLIPELKANPDDWKYWYDLPYRQAIFN